MKRKLFLSSLVLLIFAVAGGGSSIGEFFSDCLVTILIVVGVIIAVAIILNFVQNLNKKKRLELINNDENNSEDFDRSVFIGDDRCKISFDSTQKRVMIMRVMTSGIKKVYVDDFIYPGESLTNYDSNIFNVYDPNTRKLLSGSYSELNIDFTVTNISEKDKYIDVVNNSTIKPALSTHLTNKGLGPRYCILIDEAKGFIAVTEAGKLRHAFNYIAANFLPKKMGSKPFVTTKGIGNYYFIMDNFFKVLVIIKPNNYELFNYSDIIEVSYEENGSQLYTKSAARTVGGTLVGGMLMGSAGAVVGGLSGASLQNKEVKNMDIKILLRSTSRTSCVLNFKTDHKVLSTKKADDKRLYEIYLKQANEAKDILSVIIDNAKQLENSTVKHVVQTQTVQLNIADELTKLAKLKSDGVLTDEEFNIQKSKLLGL